MDRTYLYVPPEESAAVQTAGGHWDERLKCWYLEPGDDPSRFARWLGTDHQPGELTIVSDQAYVAAATVPCCGCNRPIDVICIYCESGTASGEPLTQFAVTDVLAVDDALARQLAPWRAFHPIADPGPTAPALPTTVSTAARSRTTATCTPSQATPSSTSPTRRLAPSGSRPSPAKSD